MKSHLRHRVWTGSFAALERRLSKSIAAQQQDKPFAPVWVVAGSNLLHLYLRRTLARESPVVNVRFLTLLDLAGRLAGTAGVGDDLQELFAAQVAANQVIEELPAGQADFREALEGPGFARAALGSCKDLWAAGVTNLRELLEQSELDSTKLQLLAAVEERVRQLLESAGAERTDQLFSDAADRAHRLMEVLGTDRLLVYGLYDLQWQQRLLLAACAREAALEFFVPHHECSAFRYARRQLNWHESLGAKTERVELEPQEGRPLVFHGTAVGTQDSGAAEASGEVEAAVEQRPQVQFASAPGEVREVEHAARQLLRLAAEGVQLHEMAVLFRSGDQYAPVVREVFDRANIPYYDAAGESLDSMPAGRALLEFIGLAGGSAPRVGWIDWLTNSPLDIGFTADDTVRDLWPQVTVEAGIVEGQKEWLNRLEELAKNYARTLAEEPPSADCPERRTKLESARLLHRVVEELFERCRALRQAVTWPEVAELLVELVEEFFTAEAGQLLVPALERLDSLEAVGEPRDLRTVRDLVGQSLSRVKARQGAFQRGTVAVLDVMQCRGLQFDVVFLLGMGEHVFPVQARQDPLLLDKHREALNNSLQELRRKAVAAAGESTGWRIPNTGDALPLKRLRTQEEELLFALAVGCARERLFLSYSRLDSTGRQRLPSQLMLRLAQELQGVPMTYDAFRSLDEYRRVPLTRWTALQRLGDDSMLLNSAEWSEAVVARARAQKQPQVLADLADNQPTFRRALLLEQRRWETDRLTSYDGVIGEPELRQALESRYGLQGSTLSASQVEEYATCPLRYYLRYVLGLEPFEEPESVAELSPLDRGTLYHRILERFYRRCDEVGLFPLQTAQLERYTRLLDEAAAEEFEKAEREFNVGHPLMWQLQQEQARSDLTQFLQAELERGGSWRPTGFEVWFGNGSAAVSLEGADMEFRGRIDRIDVNRQETRARVTDYKTGSLRGYKKNRLQGGETIQLPVYVLAAAALLDLPPEAVIARYASVTAGAGFKEVLFEGEEWPRAAEELRRIVEVVDAGVRRGHFFAYPGPGAENCTYCDYSAVCTAGIETIAERKAEDPVQSDFHALKEEQQ